MQTAIATNSMPAKAPRTRKPADATAFYVTALKSAVGFHKSSFHVEMAVCLAFYAEHESADMKVKKELRPIYERAGYDCKQPKGEDYKTIQRRISVAGDLYTHLGGAETITDWAEGEVGAKMIEALVVKLETRKFDSISAIKAASGKPLVREYKKKAPAEALPKPTAEELALANQVAATGNARRETQGIVQHRRVIDLLPPERVLRTEHLSCAIPLDATQDEVKDLALKLLAFAATLMNQPQPMKLAA